ncbi:hypothetical protein Tco_0546616 [Tanacetum coccineum]
MVPEETEWDCSEPFVGLGGVTLVSMGGFLDLGFLLFLESAPGTLGPCDLGKVEVTRSHYLKLQWMEHEMTKACLPEEEETDDKRNALTSTYVDRTMGWVSNSPSCESLPLFSGRDWYLNLLD